MTPCSICFDQTLEINLGLNVEPDREKINANNQEVRTGEQKGKKRGFESRVSQLLV